MDCRYKLIQDTKVEVLHYYDKTTADAVGDILTRLISAYDIRPISTEVMVVTYQMYNENIIASWEGAMVLSGKAKGTISMYKYTIQALADHCHKQLNEVTTTDVMSFMVRAAQGGDSKTTMRNKRAYLLSFYNWMVDMEVMSTNPVNKVLPVKTPKKKVTAFTSVEVDAIRSACKTTRDRAIVEVLLSSGVRAEELCNLERKDVDLESGRVTVRGGKGDKDRITYIDSLGLRYLKVYLESRSDDCCKVFVNANKTNGSYTAICTRSLGRILSGIGKSIGVDVHPHKFRRTCATNLYRRGMDLQKIRMLLGHANIATTMLYIECYDTQLGLDYKQKMS